MVASKQPACLRRYQAFLIQGYIFSRNAVKIKGRSGTDWNFADIKEEIEIEGAQGKRL